MSPHAAFGTGLYLRIRICVLVSPRAVFSIGLVLRQVSPRAAFGIGLVARIPPYPYLGVSPLAVSGFVGVRCQSGQDYCSVVTSKLGVSF